MAQIVPLRRGTEANCSTAWTGSQGDFTYQQQLPKGQAYGLVVIARGYRDVASENVLRIGAQAP